MNNLGPSNYRYSIPMLSPMSMPILPHINTLSYLPVPPDQTTSTPQQPNPQQITIPQARSNANSMIMFPQDPKKKRQQQQQQQILQPNRQSIFNAMYARLQ